MTLLIDLMILIYLILKIKKLKIMKVWKSISKWLGINRKLKQKYNLLYKFYIFLLKGILNSNNFEWHSFL